MRTPTLIPVLGLFAALALACGEGDEATTDGTTTATVLAGTGTAADPYQLDCNHSGKDLSGDVGTSYHVSCPSGCTSGSVWGTGPYTRDSRVCTAAVHAGALTSAGGTTVASIAAGLSNYEGGAANGITSNSWGSYDTSLAFAAAAPAAQKAPPPAERPAERPATTTPRGEGKAGKRPLPR